MNFWLAFVSTHISRTSLRFDETERQRSDRRFCSCTFSRIIDCTELNVMSELKIGSILAILRIFFRNYPIIIPPYNLCTLCICLTVSLYLFFFISAKVNANNNKSLLCTKNNQSVYPFFVRFAIMNHKSKFSLHKTQTLCHHDGN